MRGVRLEDTDHRLTRTEQEKLIMPIADIKALIPAM